MPLPALKLRVLPNPWAAIDHMGSPAAALPFDYYEHSQSKGWVGATRQSDADAKITPAQTMRIGNQDVEIRPAQDYRRFIYDLDPKNPVVLPNTGYYRQHIACGDLIPADAATAVLCGIVKFDGAEKMLARARAEAIARFDAETGPDAWKVFGALEPLTRADADKTPVPASKPKGDS